MTRAQAALALALVVSARCEPRSDSAVPTALVDAGPPARIATCFGRSVDLARDPLHCGRCDTSCTTSQRCDEGACVERPQACVAPGIACGDQCVDPRTSSEHCGACNRACPLGASCMSGVCRCTPTTLQACAGACVDVRTSAAHCGACDRPCRGLCMSGVCRCDPGLTNCSGRCVDVATDSAHCGRCGNSCGANRCVAGACACSGERATSCGGVCVDLRSDVAHCGECGRVCSAQADCVSGVCVPRAWWPPHGARLGTRTPALRWFGFDVGAELCADRACERVLQRIEPNFERRGVTRRLEPGVYWWRTWTRVGDGRSVTSMFRVDARDATAPGLLPPMFDVNADGLADLAVVSARPARVAVYVGARGGLAATPWWEGALADALEDPQPRAASDLDGDGFGDLVVASRVGMPFFVRGGLAGATSRTLTPAAAGIAIPSLDLDANGYGDWVVTSGTQVFAVYSTRVFGTAMTRSLPHPQGAVPATGAAMVGDLDGDGLGDLVVGAPAVRPRRVYAYLASSAGVERGVLLPPSPVTDGLGDEVRAAGDVNGDGYADVLLGLGARTTALYLGGPTIAFARLVTAPDGVEAALYAAGDVDGDGRSDLVAVPRARGELWLYRGQAEGVAAEAEVFRDARWALVETVGAPGDLDGDGFDDVALGAPSADRVEVAYGGASPFARVTRLAGAARSEFGRGLP